MDERRRLGLIVPSSNNVAEQDFARLLPTEVSLHTARMYLAETRASAERRMLERHAPRAAEDLGTVKPDAVVFSCTSAGALLGVDGEDRLEEDLGRLAGSPLVSTNASVAERLAALGVRRLGVVTAYIEELNREIVATLRDRGFEVARITGMGITDNFAIGVVTPEEIVQFTLDSMDGLEVDAVLVSCTNLRAAEVADGLAARLGVPVVTSNLAAIESALARLELPPLGVGLP
jgi:maleate isomerase